MIFKCEKSISDKYNVRFSIGEHFTGNKAVCIDSDIDVDVHVYKGNDIFTSGRLNVNGSNIILSRSLLNLIDKIDILDVDTSEVVMTKSANWLINYCDNGIQGD